MDNSEHIKDCICAWCEVDRQNVEIRRERECLCPSDGTTGSPWRTDVPPAFEGVIAYDTDSNYYVGQWDGGEWIACPFGSLIKAQITHWTRLPKNPELYAEDDLVLAPAGEKTQPTK